MDKETARTRAQACLERFLQGWQQGDHPPLSPEEIQQVYESALSRILNEDDS